MQIKNLKNKIWGWGKLKLPYPIFFKKEVIKIKILALDQASAKTGLAIFEDTELKKYNMIDLSKEKDVEQRFKLMCEKINNVITTVKPSHIVFEDVSLQTNPATLILLSQIQGAIIQTCLINNIPYDIYKPSNWRKVIGINGGKGIKRAEYKKRALDYVIHTYGINTNEDIAEAICIGSAYIKNNKLI